MWPIVTDAEIQQVVSRMVGVPLLELATRVQAEIVGVPVTPRADEAVAPVTAEPKFLSNRTSLMAPASTFSDGKVDAEATAKRVYVEPASRLELLT